MRKYEILDNRGGELHVIGITEGTSAEDALKKCLDANEYKKVIIEETTLFGEPVDIAYFPIRRGQMMMAQPISA